jgi:hypothetical protein
MRKSVGILVGFFLVLVSLGTAVAQQPGLNQPPKVLLIIREFLKPGKDGMPHERTESAFVQALSRAKEPVHYLGMNSLSGKTRALFLVPYDSFEAWEKDRRWVEHNPALSAELDRATVVDGELLESVDQGAFTYSEEYSYHPAVNMAQMRYFEIEVFQTRPGHHAEWDEAVKLVKAAYDKALPDAHWATYQAILGGRERYIVFTPMKSLAELDQEMTANNSFMAAMGMDGMKRLEELTAAGIESTETNLFAFNPKMSYISEDWIKADPAFWKPKAEPAAAKKPVEKPAAN